MKTPELQRHLLSKSTFMRGSQCTKALWLYKHRKDLIPETDPQTQAIFDQGHNIGVLAQGLFPGGIDLSPETAFDYPAAIAATYEAITACRKVLYEPAFQYDQVMAAMDILCKERRGWIAYEVKSSTEVKEQFIRDAALQYYVITNAGVPLKDIFIITINNQYTREGELDIQQLFNKTSVLEDVLELQEEIAEQIKQYKKVLKGKKEPVQDIGGHCGSPYECNFKAHCWQHVPEDSVFELRGRGAMDIAFELYRTGIYKMADIPGGMRLSEQQQLQVSAHIEQRSYIEPQLLKEFTDCLVHPLHFLDFETYQSAVPENDGQRPYQQIPFQYSLHIEKGEGEEPSHYYFLADPGKDPRREFIESLLKHIGKKGSVVVYNKSFESGILISLAEAFPDLEKKIELVKSRMVDLMSPFRSRHYYMPQMKGSYSIKSVLPALVPELSYESLEINNGGSASQAFSSMKRMTEEIQLVRVRQGLLEYCKLDTLAMVMILKKIKGEVAE